MHTKLTVKSKRGHRSYKLQKSSKECKRPAAMRLQTFTGTESPSHEAGEVERAAPVTQKLLYSLVAPGPSQPS